MSVCLFVCNITQKVVVDFDESLSIACNGTLNNLLNCRGDPNHHQDLGSFKRIISHCEIGPFSAINSVICGQ